MMEIKRLCVENLFGHLNYTVEINNDINIIHGPNGCGKTTFLELTDGVLKRNLGVLRKIPFDSFILEQKTGETICIRKINDPEKNGFFKYDCVLKNAAGKELDTSSFNERKILGRISPNIVDTSIHELTRISADKWRHDYTGEILSIDEIIYQFPDRLPFGDAKFGIKWLDNLFPANAVTFVKTNRLSRPNAGQPRRPGRSPSLIESVSVYSDDIKERINQKLSEYATVSQILDRSYPTRLLDSKSGTTSEEFIRNRYAEIDTEIKRLIEIGLMASNEFIPLPNREMTPEELKVLSLYFDDSKKKLEIFDQFARKMEVFVKRLRNKFSPTKEMILSKDDGIKFLVVETQEVVTVNQLSSGEQHQIVLIYDLIFNSIEDGFVLIDEPEISLHTTWQRSFLDDLEEIARINKLTFLIATHSPMIINGRWDLASPLGGGIENEK